MQKRRTNRQQGIKERNEKKRARRIQIESNLEKKKRERRDTSCSKVRGKTARLRGEIGKVSAEKGDTLVIPRQLSSAWVTGAVIGGNSMVFSVHRLPITKQYHPGNCSELIGRCGDLTGPFSPFCFFGW